MSLRFKLTPLPAVHRDQFSTANRVVLLEGDAYLVVGASGVEGLAQATCWRSGEPQLLPRLPHFESSYALGVNMEGVMIGSFKGYLGNPKIHRGAVWMKDTVTELPPFTSCDTSVPCGLGSGSSGVIVGTSAVSEESLSERAVFWPLRLLDECIDLSRNPDFPCTAVRDYSHTNGLVVGKAHNGEASSVMAVWNPRKAGLICPPFPAVNAVGLQITDGRLLLFGLQETRDKGMLYLLMRFGAEGMALVVIKSDLPAMYEHPVVGEGSQIWVVVNAKLEHGAGAGTPVPLFRAVTELARIDETPLVELSEITELPPGWERITCIRQIVPNSKGEPVMVGEGMCANGEMACILFPK